MGAEQRNGVTILQFYDGESKSTPTLGMTDKFLLGDEMGAFDLMIEALEITKCQSYEPTPLKITEGEKVFPAFKLDGAQQTTYKLELDLNEGEFDDFDIAKVVVKHIESIRTAEAELALPMGRDTHTFVLSGDDDLVESTIASIAGTYTAEGYKDFSTVELMAASKQGIGPLSRVTDREAANYACAATCLEMAKGGYMDQERCLDYLCQFMFCDAISDTFSINYADIKKAVDRVVPGKTPRDNVLRTGLMLTFTLGASPMLLGDGIARYMIQVDDKLRNRK